MPPSVLQGLETRGVDLTKLKGNKITAEMLDGAFKFKPKGSVESANKPQQQRLFAEGMNALTAMAAVNPMIGLILQQPQVAKAFVERWVYLYGGGLDKSAFLGQQAMQLLMQQMATPGMMPGMQTDPNAQPQGQPLGPPQGAPQ